MREIAESVNMGNLEMGIISGCYLATYDENWYLVDMPYVFKDRDTMYKPGRRSRTDSQRWSENQDRMPRFR